MAQSGPRDLESVLASRYTLTAKGWAAADSALFADHGDPTHVNDSKD